MTQFKGSRSKKDIMAGVKAEVTWSRKRMNNTIEYGTVDGSRIFRLHDTDIITFAPNGNIILDSGGWQTVTTKQRMNHFLPNGSIFQEKYIWYLAINGDQYVYQDGITIHPDHSVSNAAKEDELKTLNREIKKYVNAYCKELFAQRLPEPSSGDCWLCSMVTKDGTPLVEATHNASHLISHMEEKYYVPSLIFNAIRDCGCSQAAQWYLSYCFKKAESVPWAEGTAQQQIQKAMVRYMRRQLGLAK